MIRTHDLSAPVVAPVCQFPATHHSADVTTVWHGRPTPLTVCGYHLAAVDLTTLASVVGGTQTTTTAGPTPSGVRP